VEAAARAVGVLGTGTMGADIAQVASQTGYRMIACDKLGRSPQEGPTLRPGRPQMRWPSVNEDR
jgi:3-hydroxyacyl-CoA dehydrogenase